MTRRNSSPIQEKVGAAMLLGDATIRVWTVMHEIASTGEYFLGAPRTAQLAHCSVRQVWRAWAKIERAGLIKKVAHMHGTHIIVWRLNPEPTLDAFAKFRQGRKESAANPAGSVADPARDHEDGYDRCGTESVTDVAHKYH